MRCAAGASRRASFLTLQITLKLRSRYEGLDECRHGLQSPFCLNTHTHTHPITRCDSSYDGFPDENLISFTFTCGSGHLENMQMFWQEEVLWTCLISWSLIFSVFNFKASRDRTHTLSAWGGGVQTSWSRLQTHMKASIANSPRGQWCVGCIGQKRHEFTNTEWSLCGPQQTSLWTRQPVPVLRTCSMWSPSCSSVMSGWCLGGGAYQCNWEHLASLPGTPWDLLAPDLLAGSPFLQHQNGEFRRGLQNGYLGTFWFLSSNKPNISLGYYLWCSKHQNTAVYI